MARKIILIGNMFYQKTIQILCEGSNKITAKSSCLNNTPQNTYYSVNVTGMSPEQFKNYNQTN